MFVLDERRITRVSVQFYSCVPTEEIVRYLHEGIVPADKAIEKATITETKTTVLSARCRMEK